MRDTDNLVTLVNVQPSNGQGQVWHLMPKRDSDKLVTSVDIVPVPA